MHDLAHRDELANGGVFGIDSDPDACGAHGVAIYRRRGARG
jgi:hypothetical protein